MIYVFKLKKYIKLLNIKNFLFFNKKYVTSLNNTRLLLANVLEKILCESLLFKTILNHSFL